LNCTPKVPEITTEGSSGSKSFFTFFKLTQIHTVYKPIEINHKIITKELRSTQKQYSHHNRAALSIQTEVGLQYEQTNTKRPSLIITYQQLIITILSIHLPIKPENTKILVSSFKQFLHLHSIKQISRLNQKLSKKEILGPNPISHPSTFCKYIPSTNTSTPSTRFLYNQINKGILHYHHTILSSQQEVQKLIVLTIFLVI
jgi:hypothetical protein